MPILRFGTVEQKRRYLPRLCDGSWIGAHGMSEPDSGSDAFGLRTRADRRGNVYVLNGSKTFVTNAPVADLVLAFATIARDKGMWGVSAFLIDRDTKGLSVGKKIDKMGLSTSPMAELFLEDCEVPVESRLGAEGQGGAIFNHSMAWERACILGSTVGAMDRQLDTCLAYAKTRHQFGKPIGNFQLVAAKIAEMKVRLETARLLLYRAAWAHARGESNALEGAIAKVYISEAAVQSALNAIQVHGGYGYMKDYDSERELRNAIGGRLYSGTSEIQRCSSRATSASHRSDGRRVGARCSLAAFGESRLSSLASSSGERRGVSVAAGRRVARCDAHLRFANAQSDRVAVLLHANGIGHGDHVALFMPKSHRSVIVMLGASKAGATYVPIDPQAPALRAAYILGDCGVRGLIATSEKLDLLRPYLGALASLDTILLADDAGEMPDPPARGHVVRWPELERFAGVARTESTSIESDPAYLLYTSGSTGKPKGVILTHRNALAFVEWGARGVWRTAGGPAVESRAAALRSFGVRHLRRAAHRCDRRDGSRQYRALSDGALALDRRRAHQRVVLGAIGAHEAAAARQARSAPLRAAPHRSLRGRGVPGEVSARAHGAPAGRRVLQSVRPDRDQRLHVHADRASACVRRQQHSDRACVRQHRGDRDRLRGQARSHRRDGRAVRARTDGHGGLLGASGEVSRGVGRESTQCGVARTRLSHGRHGAGRARRELLVHRPRR